RDDSATGGAMVIRNANAGDRLEWLRMRRLLWPDCPDHEQLREIDEILQSGSEHVFFAERPEGGLCGFLEAAIRPWVDSCDSRPVGYIEGWYVDEDVRRQGVGRALVQSAETWARSKGCRQMASDAEIGNLVSQRAHGRLGYNETQRLVFFKKDLGDEGTV